MYSVTLALLLAALPVHDVVMYVHGAPSHIFNTLDLALFFCQALGFFDTRKFQID